LQNQIQCTRGDAGGPGYLLPAAFHPIEAIALLHQSLLTPRQPADQLPQLPGLLVPAFVVILLFQGDVCRGDQIAQLHAAFIGNHPIKTADRLAIDQQLLKHPL
jgi:hypothetical protein